MNRVMSEKWDMSSIGDQDGKTVIITGANSGIGFEAARAFSRRGARVVFACRSPKKAEKAISLLREEFPDAEMKFIPLDLSSLTSVKEFADQFSGHYNRLDVLLNNAGIMMVPFGITEDGFEKQIGINHFGHFALTGLLMGHLEKTPGARVVNISSNAHHGGEIDFSDLLYQKSRYTPMGAYQRSKLANLLFTYELKRRLEDRGVDALALAAHPGISATGLADHFVIQPLTWLVRGAMKLAFQSAEMGALPGLRAAVDPAAKSGEYYGPDGKGERSGYPVVVLSNPASRDSDGARRLWELSEKLTGVEYLS
jgi:NAD(P)-dependent dehydrogenase (short-subunit alcohol dehydrogenase family)